MDTLKKNLILDDNNEINTQCTIDAKTITGLLPNQNENTRQNVLFVLEQAQMNKKMKTQDKDYLTKIIDQVINRENEPFTRAYGA